MSSRPSYYRSASHSNWDIRPHEDRSRHRQPAQDQYYRQPHQSSHSEVRHPYTSNCGRRRWPPSPKVEEVKFEEEVPMRGKIGQEPLIIHVPCSSSSDSGSIQSRDSDDSSGPETPPTSDIENRDRRYVWKPEPNVPIPQTYDTARGSRPNQNKATLDVTERDRGRKKMPKLDTEMGRSVSTGGPPPPLERARSPYASGPQDRKPKPDRFSGEYMLSPDVMTPRKLYVESSHRQSPQLPRSSEAYVKGRPDHGAEPLRHAIRPSMEAQRASSHYIPRSIAAQTGKDIQARNGAGIPSRPSIDRRASDLPSPKDSHVSVTRPVHHEEGTWHPVRPPMNRRVSELPYTDGPASVAGDRSRNGRPNRPYDDSDSDHTGSRVKSSQVSPQNSPKQFTPVAKGERHHERRFSSEIPLSHSKRPLHSSELGGPPVNLSSLVSGAAITQTLNAMLKGEHTAGRRASPRASPGVSPLASPHSSSKTSPYSSPPKTPPSEHLQHRVNPIVSLKKDSPGSRPSSPLSSRSSTWTAEPDLVSPESDHRIRSRPTTLTSRQTAPLPASRVHRAEETAMLSAPGINLRSLSPAKHKKSLSSESGESDQSQDGRGEEAPSQPTSLRPVGSFGRQRSASTADVRPKLTVDPPAFMQTSGTSTRGSRPRDLSPSLRSPSNKYRPSELEPSSPASRARPSRPEASDTGIRSRSRSRSYAPEPTFTNALTSSPSHPASRSESKVSDHASTDARSRPSASKHVTHGLIPIPPGKLPRCPRPHPVAGYDDWYTFRQNSAFTICPSCHDDVFGSMYQDKLQRQSVAPNHKTLCHLNNPWVLLALTLRGPDVNLISSLSTVISKERSCPKDELAPREWYRLGNPENGKHIPGFNACPSCVHSLEILFSPWRNVFYRSGSSHHTELKERFCSLRTSKIRFGDYLDMFVESTQEAEIKRKPPDTRAVCDLAKQMAAIDECPKDKMSSRKAWHIHPHLPEFTICQECYEDVVYPKVKAGLFLAAKIDRRPQSFPNPDVSVCCHLYSKRMRKVFEEACEDDDYEHLRHTVLKRHMLQQDLLATLQEHHDHPGDAEVSDRLRELLAKWKEKE